MSGDKLYQAADFYEKNLKDKKFKLIAGRKGKLIELSIFFGAEHFKHLAGIHKLIDSPISKRASENIYKEILDEKITISDIQKSRFFFESDERLSNFDKVKDILFATDLMLKSLKGYFLGITANYLLSKDDEEASYAHLFLKESGGIVIPVTFFVCDDDRYLRNSVRWKVLWVEEVKKSTEIGTPQ